ELVAEFAVREPPVRGFRHAPPRSKMHFVNGNWRFEPIFLYAILYPRGVVPPIILEARDDGSRIGAQLRPEGVGVGLERKYLTAGADDFVFVDAPFAQLRQKHFPNAGRAPGAHGMDAAVPAIEIAHHA